MKSFTHAFSQQYREFKDSRIHGRYLPPSVLEPVLLQYKPLISTDVIGYSVEQRSVYRCLLGNGPVRILAWSQMHGNESTTTKAVLDLFSCYQKSPEFKSWLDRHFTISIIPMLNPDGAERYTRANANDKDLNRDALVREEPESRILAEELERFKPDFAFNLHDQRSLFSAGDGPNPATLSFLAPAYDEGRSVNEVREAAMKLIVGMNRMLQEVIPGQVGRFDDGFNLNCVGDRFTQLGIPTILFEAGHFQEDYEREQTRKFMGLALLEVLGLLADQDYKEFTVEEYLGIPQNQQLFFDRLVRGVSHVFEGRKTDRFDGDIGFRFVEVLENGKIRFKLTPAQMGDLSAFYGHQEEHAGGYALSQLALSAETFEEVERLLFGYN